MTIERWIDSNGHEGVFFEGRLSIAAKPSLTADDGTVIVGIDAPWVDQLISALNEARLYGQKMLRDRDETVRRCGADLVQLIDAERGESG